MAHHVERTGKIIERELSTILLMEAKNHLLKYVSITKVSLTNDMSLATIWFSVIGQTDEIEATKKALIDSKGFLRSELSKRLDIRKTPDLKFKYDESLEYGKRIEELLNQSK
ncbi:MAG: 30S ribosome-binding factor RbfA [Bacilli bacterium]|nr:30S ribosome-binding factor RbfA [Bacilli bacterium]